MLTRLTRAVVGAIRYCVSGGLDQKGKVVPTGYSGNDCGLGNGYPWLTRWMPSPTAMPLIGVDIKTGDCQTRPP